MEFKIGFHHGKRGTFNYKHPIYLHPSIYIDNTGNIDIGAGVSVSRETQIYTHEHYHYDLTVRETVETNCVRITNLEIGDDAYIGANVTILASCNKIGKRATIGAGSIVTCDIPDYEIWTGNPAVKINEIKERLTTWLKVQKSL
jgi:acetyltransferase-like isoleucine patch superfamily enzyme